MSVIALLVVAGGIVAVATLVVALIGVLVGRARNK
jgi:hypothetical protein